MATETTQDTPGPVLALSIPQAAAALGLSERMVYRLVESGRIPAKRVGRRRIISAAWLARWVDPDLEERAS